MKVVYIILIVSVVLAIIILPSFRLSGNISEEERQLEIRNSGKRGTGIVERQPVDWN